MAKHNSFQEKKMLSSHNCMNCLKKEKSLYNELSFAELELFEKGRLKVGYKTGETIYKEGMKPLGLICLNAGKLKITRMAHNGTEQIVSFKKPVDFVDLGSVINDMPYTSTATAIDDSSICIIDKDNFMNVLKHNPEFSLKIMRSLVGELDEADYRFISMTQKYLPARLADSLLLLYEMYGTLPDGKTINCNLKRAELAAMSNMTTANVIRTLSDFEKTGLVSLNKKQIKIMDLELMKETSRGV